MTQPKLQAREAPDSLSPIPIGASDEEEIAKMRGPRGLRVTLTLLVVAAAVAGGAQLLRMMDDRQAYAIAASQLEHSDSEQREAFMRCALPNYQRSQVANANALRGALESATERMERSYGKQLARCAPLLAGFEQAVHEIKAPTDMRGQLSAVASAADAVGKSFRSYEDFLLKSGQPYSFEQASPMIEAIAGSWQRYLSARTQAKQALSAQL